MLPAYPMRRIIAALVLAQICLAPVPGARADENYGRAADNPIYAQTLVNQVQASNARLISTGMHVASPGTDQYCIIATTLNVVGKKCSPEDLEVAVGGHTVLTPNVAKAKLGILLPLHDRTGRQIGGLALAFRYQPGDDQAKLLAEAIALRDGLAREIPQVAALFVVGPPAPEKDH
jgi:hypothetical protein